MRTESTRLLRKLRKEGLNSNDEYPMNPHWLRNRFPDDYQEIEGYLHIMTWQDFLERLCYEIQSESHDNAINFDYIDRDAQEIQLANHIQAHLPDNLGTCYFDTEAPLDKYSNFITYDIVYERAQDYQGPKGVE